MAKPSFNFSRLVKLLACTALVASLTSCYDLDIKIIFTDFTTGRVEVNYSLPQNLQGLRSSDGKLLVTLPGDRAGWEALVATTGTATGGAGASVVSFAATDTVDGPRYRVVLGFTRAQVLESLFTAQGQKLTLLSNNGVFTLTQAFNPAGLNQLTADTAGLFRALYGKLPLRLEVQAPRPITSASTGEVLDGRRTAVLKLTWEDLLRTPPPADWRLVWQ